jgi:hypothetical protein
MLQKMHQVRLLLDDDIFPNLEFSFPINIQRNEPLRDIDIYVDDHQGG